MNIRKKGKIEKATEFVKRMRKIQEEVEAVLRKIQEKMKRQANSGQREREEWKKEDKVILSMKDLIFKERLVKKLIKRYV